MNMKISFCPICGEKLFVAGRRYLIDIQCLGQSYGDTDMLMVFLDDTSLYEVRPGENICFPVEAGFHTLKFRRRIRSKTISLLVTSSYVIRTNFNSLSGLIETSVNMVEDSEDGIDAADLVDRDITSPVMVSPDGWRTFGIMLGDDEPEFEIKCSSGLAEGVLRIYTERAEFSPSNKIKNDIVHYKNVVAVRKKMGAIDLQCEGNVHKVYSIPKDIYNEVMAYLTNRVAEVQGRE